MTSSHLSLLKKTQLWVNKSTLVHHIRRMRIAAPSFVHLPTQSWPGNFEQAHAFIRLYQQNKDGLHKNFWAHADDNQESRLQTFGWLDDLRLIGDNNSRRLMRSGIFLWIKDHTSYHHDAWRPEVLAQRLTQWLNHFEFFGQSADDAFLRLFYKSVYHQFIFLQKTTDHLSQPSINAILALKTVLLFHFVYDHPFLKDNKRLFTTLVKIVESLVLKDGFIVSGLGDDQLLVLKHLIELRYFLRLLHLGKETAKLQQIITKMIPPLRFFRHGDGALSFLSGKSIYTSSLIDTILTVSDVKGRHPLRSEECGIERLQIQQSLLLVKTRYSQFPQQSSGNLQFEWSYGKERVLHVCDLILESQSGSPIHSRSTAHVYRQQDDNHAFMEIKINDLHHQYTREICLSPHRDIRAFEKMRTSQRAFGALRFIIAPHLTPHISTDMKSINLMDGHKNCYRLHFAGTEELTLSTTSFIDAENQTLFALFEIPANTPKEIKWSLTHVS